MRGWLGWWLGWGYGFPQEIWTNRYIATLSQFGHPTMLVLVKGLRPSICPCIFRLWEIILPWKLTVRPFEDGGFQVRNLQNSRWLPVFRRYSCWFQGGYSNLPPEFFPYCWLCGWKSWDPTGPNLAISRVYWGNILLMEEIRPSPPGMYKALNIMGYLHT